MNLFDFLQLFIPIVLALIGGFFSIITELIKVRGNHNQDGIYIPTEYKFHKPLKVKWKSLIIFSSVGFVFGIGILLLVTVSNPKNRGDSSQIEYNGKVFDSNTHLPIHGAEVLLDFSETTFYSDTDSEGSYRFTLNRSNQELKGRLKVSSTNYQEFDLHITLNPDNSVIDDINMIPLSPTATSISALELSVSPTPLIYPGPAPTFPSSTTELKIAHCLIAESSFVGSGYPDLMRGSTRNLFIGYDKLYNRMRTRAYFKFDLACLPQNIFIESADLKIYQYISDAKGVYVITAYNILSDWKSGGLSWNNQPPKGDIVGSSYLENESGWKTIDITGLVKHWQALINSNYGFLLQLEDENQPGGIFWSGSCSITQCPELQHPFLEVIYHSILAYP